MGDDGRRDGSADGEAARDRLARPVLERIAEDRVRVRAAAEGPEQARAAVAAVLAAVGERLFDRGLTVAALAAGHALGASRVAKAFRRALGVTPGAYLRRRRLDVARRLLVETDEPIQKVARSVGFHPRAFTRAFKRAVGCSPGALRARRRNEELRDAFAAPILEDVERDAVRPHRADDARAPAVAGLHEAMGAVLFEADEAAAELVDARSTSAVDVAASFEALMGESPFAYLARRRREVARALARSTDLTTATIEMLTRVRRAEPTKSTDAQPSTARQQGEPDDAS